MFLSRRPRSSCFDVKSSFIAFRGRHLQISNQNVTTLNRRSARFAVHGGKNLRLPKNCYRYVTADWGKNGWAAFDGSNVSNVSKNEFKNLNFLRNAKYLIVEYAHLQVARTKASLAQVYTAEELLDIYARAEKNGVQILLFPQHVASTYRVADGMGLEKKWGEDYLDAIALHKWVKQHPTEMMAPRKEFDNSTPARKAIYEFRDETNQILNWARSRDYCTVSDDDWQFAGKRDGVKALLGDADFAAFGSNDDRFNQVCYLTPNKEIASAIKGMSMTQMYTIASMFVRPDYKARIRGDTGEMPGMRWLLRNQIGTTAFHFRGGIARSNIYHHGVKNFCVVKNALNENIKLGQLNSDQWLDCRQKRRQYMKAVKFLLAHLRNVASGKSVAGLLF